MGCGGGRPQQSFGFGWPAMSGNHPCARLRGAHPIVFFSIMHEIDKYLLLGMFLMHGRRFKILGDLFWFF